MSTYRLDFIQALRAFAVLAVVAYHFPGALPFAVGGYGGVDLFFVISGFIITWSTPQPAPGWRDALVFTVKRATRIWPPYAVASILTFVWLVWALHDDMSTGVVQLLGGLSLLPMWSVGPVVQPGWSLVFEVYFYALFAISLLFGRFRWWVLVGLSLAGLVGVPLVLSGHIDLTGTTYGFPGVGIGGYWFISSSPIIWAFLMGVGIARIIAATPLKIESRLATVVLLVPVGALIWCLMYVWRPLHSLPWSSVMAVGILILALHNKARPIFVPRLLVWVGNASYSVYIVHWAVVRSVYVGVPAEAFASARLTLAVLAAYGLVVGILSIASYVWLERGISNQLRDWLLNLPASLRLVRTPTAPPAS